LQKIGSHALTKGRQSLSIGHMHYRYVNHAAADLLRAYGANQLHLEVYEGVRGKVISMVESRQCDIGLIGMFSHYHKITIKQLETKGMQYFRLCSSPVTVIVGKGSPLFSLQKEELDIETVRDYPIVIYNESELGPYTSIIEAVGLGGHSRRIVVSERSTLFDMLDKTPCFSVTTTDEIAYQNTDYYDQIRSFRLKNCQITGEIGWIKRTDVPQSKQVLDFLQVLSSYYTVMNGILPL
jgi:DNA-binding transcriptional LysR family regulator